MRAFAWSCVIVGVLLGVAAFVITAHSPVNPWPTLVAGFCLTAFGVVVLARARQRQEPETLTRRRGPK
jgi:uncharacterized membrane protein HdeD (DUF308 family)